MYVRADHAAHVSPSAPAGCSATAKERAKQCKLRALVDRPVTCQGIRLRWHFIQNSLLLDASSATAHPTEAILPVWSNYRHHATMKRLKAHTYT
jgi:hypothetical protein